MSCISKQTTLHQFFQQSKGNVFECIYCLDYVVVIYQNPIIRFNSHTGNGTLFKRRICKKHKVAQRDTSWVVISCHYRKRREA